MSEASVILIAGPTASGKSRFAREMAAREGGVIVNADSMQVYRELRVLSARPSVQEETAVPHHLYGHVSAATRYSVGAWLADVAPALAEVQRAGRAAIVVGGTGLYFKALTEGLAAMPPVPSTVRETLARETVGAETPALYARLAALDSEDAAAIRPSDRSRIVRALEVFTATGLPLVVWQRTGEAKPLVTRARRMLLLPERAELHRRIAARAAAMVEGGAVDEVRALAALDLDAAMPAMKAIGVREILAYLAGKTSLDEASAAMATETRRYARRQLTWFRNQMAGWPVVSA